MFNFVTKLPYSGQNAVTLASAKFQSPYFLTFNQANQVGLRIRKGSKGIPLVRIVKVEEKGSDGRVRKTNKPKYFTVFNIEQTEEVKQEIA